MLRSWRVSAFCCNLPENKTKLSCPTYGYFLPRLNPLQLWRFRFHFSFNYVVDVCDADWRDEDQNRQQTREKKRKNPSRRKFGVLEIGKPTRKNALIDHLKKRMMCQHRLQRHFLIATILDKKKTKIGFYYDQRILSIRRRECKFSRWKGVMTASFV